MKNYNHWIDGEEIAPADRPRMERNSPADGHALASILLGTPDDVERAVRAARQAFDHGSWARLSGIERSEALGRFADLMQANGEELARLEAEEAGKPITAARMEIGISVRLARYAATLAWDVAGRLSTDGGPDKIGMVIRQPRGVAGLIVAWNYPALCLMQKLPFALAAGCATVVKPSEFTPGSTLMIAKLAEQAGIPKGQINVVLGTGDAVGAPLTTAKGVDMISFTGSSRVGRQVAVNCAENFRHCSLELGGKGSNIIFADADIDAAVEATYIGFTFNKGEECCSSARILLEESIAAKFTAKLVERCRKAKIGAPLDEATDVGPLIHEQQFNRVMGFIEAGKADGATILAGGVRATEGGLANGYFVPPTIFSDVRPDMSIFQDEIFGPVTCIVTFKTPGEAVRIANDTPYGLANGVWTTNIDKAMTVLRQLRSGMVYVNTYFESLPQLPLGGMKDSGHGHENGVEGLQEFLETRSAFIKVRNTF